MNFFPAAFYFVGIAFMFTWEQIEAKKRGSAPDEVGGAECAFLFGGTIIFIILGLSSK